MSAAVTARPRLSPAVRSSLTGSGVPGDVILAPSYVLNLPATGGYAAIPAIGAYNLGTGDLTVEAWINTATGGPVVSLAAGTNALLTLQVGPNGDLSVMESGKTALAVGQPTSAANGQWHHLALVRQGGTLTLYLDGIEQATGPESPALNLSGLSNLLFGTATTAAGAPTFTGSFAEVRLWNVARSQAQILGAMFYRLPAAAPVIGYWTFTDQNLNDRSSNHNSGGTLGGKAAYTYLTITYAPASGALVLTGASPSVAIGGHAAYNVGAGDFTLEAWINPASGGDLISRRAPGGANAAGFSLTASTNGLLSFTTSDGTHVTTATQTMTDMPLLGGWHHVGVTRQSGTITIYLDGIPVGSATEATPVSISVPTTVPLTVGHGVGVHAAPEIVLAEAVGGPTPILPSAVQEYMLIAAVVRLWGTALSQDRLYRGMLIESHGDEPGLLGFWSFATGNVIDQSTTRNLAVAPYTATVALNLLPIAQAQYVLNLPGTAGGYLTIPSETAYNVGTGNFTIELRFAASAGGTLLSRPRDPAQPSCGVQVRVTGSSLELIVDDGQQPHTYSATAALLDNQWHHVAWVRSSGTLSAFVDDRTVACTPTASTTAIQTTTPLVIGAQYTPSGASYSDYVTARIDYVYLWASARTLAELQRDTYLLLGDLAAQTMGSWTFDQQAPIDGSPVGANGSLGSGASIVAEYNLPVTVSRSVAHLPGGTSSIDCTSRTDLSFGGVQPYTIGAWVRPMGANATGTIVSRFDQNGTGEYRLRLANGRPVAERVAAVGTVTGVTQLLAERWYFVAMSYDGTTLSLSVNGIVEATGVVGAVTAATGTHVTIGATSNGGGTTDSLAACIQDVQFWTKPLDTAAIQTAMQGPLTGAEDRLQAYWTFLYASAQDWTGHGPAAAFQNVRYQATSLVAASLPKALAFNGSGQYVDCGGGRSLNVRGAMTLEAWVRITSFSAPWQVIAAKGSVYQFRRYQSTNQITFSTASVQPAAAQELPSTNAVNLVDGRWHHVAATYDGQTKSLYVDGVLNASVAATGSVATGNGVLYVANNDGEVLVLDQETGADLWTARTFKPIATSPVIDKNVMCVSSPSGNIFAYDYQQRARLWDAQIAQNYQVPLTIHRDVVYYSGAGTALSAIDLLSGQHLWSMNGLANAVTPLIHDGKAYYANGYTLFCRDLVSARILWTYSLTDQIVGGPALVGNVLYVNCADNNVYALLLGKVVSRGGTYQASAALVGSPIVEDGTIYVAATDGTIAALTYDTTFNTFSATWTQKVAAGLTAALAVDFPYVGAIGNDQTLYAYSAVDGKAVWQYQATGASALSGLTVVNGAAYCSAANGTYLALDLEQKKVIWSKDIQTIAQAPAVVTYAPFCIGASVNEQGTVAAGSFNGLISEVRLWSSARSAKEIAATWKRKLVGDEANLAGYWACAGQPGQQELDLSVHLNPGSYVGGVGSSIVDFTLQEPLPRIVAQARMMQHWDQKDASAGNKDGQIVFRTEISLLNGNGLPLTGTGIRVWTDEATTVISGGVSYAVSPTQAASLATDARGMITIVTPCNALTSPTLQIWADFMPADERVIIHPDDNLNETLGNLSGADLINPGQSANPLLKDKPPLLTNASQDQANGLANAINNAIQNVKRPDTQPSLYAATRGPRPLGAALPVGDAVSQPILLRDGKPYQQTVGPGSIPNWQFNFGTYAFNPIQQSELVTLRATREAQGVMTKEVEGFWDLWDDFVNGVKKAANVIIEIVSAGVQIVVHWVEQGIDALQHVFESVAQVGQAIYGFFKQILSDVVDAAKKVYEFFAFLFKWDDILVTKNAIVGQFQESISTLNSTFDSLLQTTQSFFDSAESQVDAAFESLIGRIGKQTMDQLGAQAPSIDPMLPQPTIPTNTRQLAAMRMQAVQDSKGSYGAEGNWLMSTALDNSEGITGGAVIGSDTTSFNFLDEAFDAILGLANGSKGVAAFRQAGNYFSQVFSHPESFATLILQGLLEAMKGLIELAIEAAKAVLTILLKAMRGLLNLAVAALTAEIDIPVVSWLYEQISGGSKLTLLDFTALLVAVPTTIIYKAFTGEAPFQGNGNRMLTQDLTASTWLTTKQRGCRIAQAMALTLSLAVVIPADVQPPMAEGYEAIGSDRLTNFFNAVNVREMFTSQTLGPNLLRWIGAGLQLINAGCGAPWIYSDNPSGVDVANWLLGTLVGAALMDFVLAIVTFTKGFLWNDPLVILSSVMGFFRLFMHVMLAFAMLLSGNAWDWAKFTSQFFIILPSVAKILRLKWMIAQFGGLSLVALVIIDLLGYGVAAGIYAYMAISGRSS